MGKCFWVPCDKHLGPRYVVWWSWVLSADLQYIWFNKAFLTTGNIPSSILFLMPLIHPNWPKAHTALWKRSLVKAALVTNSTAKYINTERLNISGYWRPQNSNTYCNSGCHLGSQLCHLLYFTGFNEANRVWGWVGSRINWKIKLYASSEMSVLP